MAIPLALSMPYFVIKRSRFFSRNKDKESFKLKVTVVGTAAGACFEVLIESGCADAVSNRTPTMTTARNRQWMKRIGKVMLMAGNDNPLTLGLPREGGVENKSYPMATFPSAIRILGNKGRERKPRLKSGQPYRRGTPKSKMILLPMSKIFPNKLNTSPCSLTFFVIVLAKKILRWS